MRRRAAWLAGTVAISFAALTAPALALAESVGISFEGASVGHPLSITVAGTADGFVFAVHASRHAPAASEFDNCQLIRYIVDVRLGRRVNHRISINRARA